MNDKQLNDLLHRAAVPQRKDAEWQESAGETMRRLRLSQSVEGKREVLSRPGRWKSIAVWSAGWATACIVIGFILGNWHAGQRDRSFEVAEARKLFGELSAMFPNQLDAVVIEGTTPRLVLTDQPMPQSSAPLFVRICGPRGCQRLITFSGRRVQVNGENCEVLADARGGIIVTGETFVWSSSSKDSRAGRYNIEATPLAQML